jgi:hypothetical protein
MTGPPFHEVWASLRRLLGSRLRTTARHQPFVVKDISTESVTVVLPEGRGLSRRIPREEFERAWQQLRISGHLAHKDLPEKPGSRNAVFVTSLLAQVPGIRHRDSLLGLHLMEGGKMARSATPADARVREPDRGAVCDSPPGNTFTMKLESWLQANGWRPSTRRDNDRDRDIEARNHAGHRWRILAAPAEEPPAPSTSDEFLGALGALLQRMEDPLTMYSIALPDVRLYRGLWERLPILSKRRLGITALFVDDNGGVTHRVD